MIGVGTVDIGTNERLYIEKVLDSGLITAGPILTRFEELFARRHGRVHGIMVNSGTSALQIALAALKERHKWADYCEVIVPALTFIASSNMILEVGLIPVFVDVDPFTYTIDTKELARAITPRTVAIMPVHLFGLPCDMGQVMALAKQHDLCVVEDSCEAMAVTCNAKPVGSFGDVACFSTYAAHLISTGVGGLAITSNQTLYSLMRSYANHGRDPEYLGFADSARLNPTKHLGKNLGQVIDRRFRFERRGWSHRTTQLEAALGMGQLERLDAIIKKRQSNAAMLTKNLSQIYGLQLPTIPPGREHAFMMFPIVLGDEFDRKSVLVHLETMGVETRPFFDVINQPCYASMESLVAIDEFCPVSKRLSAKGFYVGCHQNLTQNDLWAIVGHLEAAMTKNRKVAA